MSGIPWHGSFVTMDLVFCCLICVVVEENQSLYDPCQLVNNTSHIRQRWRDVHQEKKIKMWAKEMDPGTGII